MNKKLAERVAELLGNDGQVWETEDGETLDDLAMDRGAHTETHPDKPHLTRYVFDDGSAIVASEGAWDIEGSEPFSWAGEEGRGRLSWEVIEDSGGGLHLAVLDGDRVIYYADGYEHNEDGLRADLEALRKGADPRNWEMSIDPQAAYDSLESDWEVVADQDGIYYSEMGSAALRVFEEDYWEE